MPNPSPSEPRFRLGVLFVHGIGQQRLGETLRSHADPLIQWLRERLLASDPQVQPGLKLSPEELLTIDSGSFSRDENTPPHLDLSFWSSPVQQDGDDNTPQPALREKWRCAECYWADAFPEPTSTEVAKWTIPIIPAAIVSHFARHLRPHQEGKTLDWILRRLALLLIVPAVVLMTFAMLLLLLLSYIPFEKLKAVVAVFQEKLALVLGDSYVFIQSPSRRASILERFRSDLRALAADCKEVVVVAHSQGAAVAYHGLRTQAPPANLDLLVTLGAGVNKLWELRCYREYLQPLHYYNVLGVILIAVVLGANLVAPGALAWGGWLAATAVPVVAYCAAACLWDRITKKAKKQPKPLTVPWHDYFASLDPVSNGPLPHRYEAEQSTRIRNYHSLIFDHNAYTSNRHEYIPGLVSSLTQHTSSAVLNGLRSLDLTEASEHRQQLLCYLNLAKIIVLIGAFLSFFFGQEWTRPLLDKLRSIVSNKEAGGLIDSNTVLLALALGGIALVLYWLFYRFWLSLSRRNLEALLRAPPRNNRWISLALVSALTSLAVLSIGGPFFGEIHQALGADRTLTLIKASLLPPLLSLIFKILADWPPKRAPNE